MGGIIEGSPYPYEYVTNKYKVIKVILIKFFKGKFQKKMASWACVNKLEDFSK